MPYITTSIETREKLEMEYERRRAATEREMQAEFDAKLSSLKSQLEQQVLIDFIFMIICD